MAFLMENIPRFDCLVRREYTRDMQDGHGEYLQASAEAILAVRSDSFWFQVAMHEPYAGAMFLLPVEALVTQPCSPVPTNELMPWDCFSSSISVLEMSAVRRARVQLFKEGMAGEYRFSVGFTGSDLADMPSQRKILHVVFREDGIIGAWPNNRCVFVDRALYGDFTAKPDFTTLSREFRAEGLVRRNLSTKPDTAQDNEHYAPKDPPMVKVTDELRSSFSLGHRIYHLTPPNGVHSDPKERPDWQQPV